MPGFISEYLVHAGARTHTYIMHILGTQQTVGANPWPRYLGQILACCPLEELSRIAMAMLKRSVVACVYFPSTLLVRNPKQFF